MQTKMHEDINRLLNDFGNHLGLKNLELDDQGHCCLNFDEIYVNIQAIDESSSVLLYSSLGRLPEDAGRDVHVRLLEANYFFQRTAGATLGMEAATGLVAMTITVDLADMELTDWEAAMKAFVDAAENCVQLFHAVPQGVQELVRPSGFNHIILA